MRREPKAPVGSTAADDCCLDISEVLDTFDWGELTPPQTPRSQVAAPFDPRVRPFATISGESPFEQAGQVNHLDLCSDEEQKCLMSSAGEGGSFGLADWATTQPDQKPKAQDWITPPSPSGAAGKASKASDGELSVVEVRRQKNREWMRKSRQKQREALNTMKLTVARLEKQYTKLSLSAARTMNRSINDALVARSRIASDYADAVGLTRRLGAENLYLKSEIQQQAAWKLHLSRALQSCMEMEGPHWAQQFQQPALGGEEVLHMRLDLRDQLDAAEQFGFHPLTDLRLTQLILENSRMVVLVPNTYVMVRDAKSPTNDISIFRSVFVRFLIETSKKIPSSKVKPSFDAKYYSRNPSEEDIRKKVAWAHLSLSIGFLNVVNPNTLNGT
ncbi:hypothetical protein PHYSODRAFT_333369 [Phytophthora sojae]|uniref:BZIP domain-containing protein n=1 Tax=Phytophthora sojae (strain P6497) TaxID=1094619 RepID=G4ZNS4_PHYSP|nr:hypothetical protein PHYSODRAFT_333369 [Phytophthora sojae]EGZ15097.1 hypothetical protein PHYSODRAFT_333369 [Phytophthora sojae]|eukprot:XP_009528846.1 hypothetical protein PHYSODRAFT_333369 [Phytophthora sojae]